MHFLARVFLGALVRRLAVSAAFVVLAVFGSCGRANASDEGESYASAVAYANTTAATYNSSDCVKGNTCYQACTRVNVSASTVVAWISQGASCSVQFVASKNFVWEEGRTCGARNGDSSLNQLGNTQPGYSDPNTCYGGCKVQGDLVSNSQPGGVTMTSMVNRTWSDDVCSASTSSDAISQTKDNAVSSDPKPECTALGNGQTGCAKPDGEWCATASTGKTFCWTPTETGAKVDGTDAQTKTTQGQPVTAPSMSIADSEAQRTEGHQVTACVNSTCATYNVTNFTAVAAGTAKNSTADNKADGTTNTSGNGTTSGSGKTGTDDDSDSASDSGNCDVPPVCTGSTLACLQLKFTWKNKCNTEHDEITEGDGCGESDVPVCAGSGCKAQAYAQLVQQWQQKCATQAIGEGLATRAGKNGQGDDGDADAVSGIWKDGTGDKPVFNTGLVSVATGAPLLPDVEIEGQKWVVPQDFYDVIAALKILVIAMATIMAAFIAGKVI